MATTNNASLQLPTGETLIMRHYFVLGENSYTMAYSIQTGEWQFDQAEIMPFHNFQPVVADFVEYDC